MRALRGDYEAETEAVLPLIDHAGPPTPRSFALWARRRLLPLAGALFACALLFCVCSMLSLYSRTTDSGYAAAAYGGKRGLATSALRPPAAATAAPQPPLMTAEAHGEGAVGSSTRRDGRGERGGSRRRVVAETASTSSFLDPYSHLTLQQRQHIASGTSRGVDFDENGKRIRHKRGVEPTFVAFNHPPSRDANNSTAGRQHKGGGAPPPPPPLSASERLRLRYRSRKFLLPLLDQGPNNQYLQFRVAVAKARALNRTLVLPVWLPHNPKFLHLHPGAPPVPSRDRAIALLSFPFNSTFDAAHLAKFVRAIELPTFRTLTEGQLELCLALGSSHTDDAGFRDYLRLAGLSCSNFTSMDQPDERRERAAAARARYLGYHSYDREVGLRDRAFLPLRWSGPVLSVAERVAAELNLTHGDYVAAHIRVADAHWEHSDCHHSINGVPVPSVSCGDGTNVINYTSLAQEVRCISCQPKLRALPFRPTCWPALQPRLSIHVLLVRAFHPSAPSR